MVAKLVSKLSFYLCSKKYFLYILYHYYARDCTVFFVYVKPKCRHRQLIILSFFIGLPNDLAIYWQQYPWMLGEICCRLRSWVSEM